MPRDRPPEIRKKPLLRKLGVVEPQVAPIAQMIKDVLSAEVKGILEKDAETNYGVQFVKEDTIPSLSACETKTRRKDHHSAENQATLEPIR